MAQALSSKEYNIDISGVDFASLKGRVSSEDLERLLTN